MLTMYLRCLEYSTVSVGLVVLKFFLMGYFISGGSLPPRALFRPNFPLLCSSALLSPSLVPAPSCKLPWSLFLTPLMLFSPRSLWLLAVGYSKWLGGPSISTACGNFAMGWGGWLERGVGSIEG